MITPEPTSIPKTVQVTWKGVTHQVTLWRNQDTGMWYWLAARLGGTANTEHEAMSDAREWIRFGAVPKTR